jgi:hypothetical protein
LKTDDLDVAPNPPFEGRRVRVVLERVDAAKARVAPPDVSTVRLAPGSSSCPSWLTTPRIPTCIASWPTSASKGRNEAFVQVSPT